jgi:GTP1/Obg family GTP-binding protein
MAVIGYVMDLPKKLRTSLVNMKAQRAILRIASSKYKLDIYELEDLTDMGKVQQQYRGRIISSLYR